MWWRPIIQSWPTPATGPSLCCRRWWRAPRGSPGAGWRRGLCTGVLNTDNMNLTGESFDYGPYRFLPYNDPNFTAAYFDHQGLYSFGRQPEAVFWNLPQLAGALSLVAESDALVGALNGFSAAYRVELTAAMLARRWAMRAQGGERRTRRRWSRPPSAPLAKAASRCGGSRSSSTGSGGGADRALSGPRPATSLC